MRYYDIQISNQSGKQVRRYTSYLNGQTLPGALDVELDIPVIDAATPMGTGTVRVWGTGLQDIGQASDLNNMLINVYAGMKKGLPLANPAQSGLIAAGYILQAFGNWIGVDQTLDLVIAPGTPPVGAVSTVPSAPAPKNIVLNWLAGQSLALALKNALSVAYPGVTISINVNANLIRNYDQISYYSNVNQLAQWVRRASLDIRPAANYPGVSIVFEQSTIRVFDGTASATGSAVTQIAFQDLIGQPTWIDAPSIQLKTVMRADLKVGSGIKMPPTVVINTAQAQSFLVNQKAAFAGKFQISSLRHVGHFRQADAAAWVSVVEAFPETVQ